MRNRTGRLAATVGALAIASGCMLPTTGSKARPVAAEGQVSTGVAGTVVSVGVLTGTLRGPRPGVIADNAASVLSNNASGLIANNGGGLVSDRGAGYRVRSVEALTAPVPDAEVTVVDAQGRVLTARPIKTDAEGRFQVSGLKTGRGVLFVQASYQQEGQSVTLMAPAASAGAAQAIAVDPASTLVAKKLTEQLRVGSVKPESVRPAALAEAARAVGETMTAKAVAAAAILPPAKAAESYDAMLTQSAPLATTIAKAEAEAAAQAEASPSPTPSATVAASPSPATSAKPASAAPSTAPSAAVATAAPVAGGLAGLVSTLAGSDEDGLADGTGTAARFDEPLGLAFDRQGDLLVADSDNHAVRRVTPAGVVSTVAGGLGTALDTPEGLAVDAAGTIYVADSGANRIFKVSATGAITAWAGSGDSELTNGPAASAAFDEPRSLVFDRAGNLYVADTKNHAIRKITPAGVVSTLAGGGLPGSTDGTGGAARFTQPWGLAIDGADTLYVTDRMAGRIRQVTPAGVVTTVPGSFTYPSGIVCDPSGALYITEELGYCVTRVEPPKDKVRLAGGGLPGFANGQGAAARFKAPAGLARDSRGRLFVADTNNHSIRRIE
jgi:sugar lactone lactonase YvrE